MAIGLKTVTSTMGYQQITSLSTSVGLTVPTQNAEGLNQQPSMAIIIAEGANVRYRDDGVAPTATVGMPLATGVAFTFDGDLTKIRFIEQSASAKINVVYYA
jgi:hypothetical protein